MPIELPVAWIVALNVGGWLLIQIGLAWLFTRLPTRWFRAPRARLRPPAVAPAANRPGAGRFAVKRWKDRLPDGANWFAGGFAKARLARRDPAYLERFLHETWRGELCHWCAIACTPLFALWNPWWGTLVNLAYALAANLPCIVAQHHNRARLQALLRRIASRRDGGPAPDSRADQSLAPSESPP